MPAKTVTVQEVDIAKLVIDPVAEKVTIFWRRVADNGSIYDHGEVTLFKQLPPQDTFIDMQGNEVAIPYPETWGEMSTGEFNSLNAILNKARNFVRSRPFID